MKKIISVLTALTLFLTILTACRGNESPVMTVTAKPEAPDTIRVGALKGPTAIGMVKLMEDNAENLTQLNYSFTIGTVDEIIAKISRGELDFAAVPANISSVLYNNTDGAVQAFLINTLGVLYIVERGDSIKEVGDLRGKTIYSTGKGTTPEFALNYVLSQNGLDPEKDVTVEYKSEAAEIIPLLAQNEGSIAFLPQPFAAAAMDKVSGLQIALDWSEQWDKVSDGKSSLITGVVLISRDFAEKYSGAAGLFAREYLSSTLFVTSNVEEAAVLTEKYGIIDERSASLAIPYCNISLIAGSSMEKKLNGYLEVLYSQNPQSVGGKLPDEKFYFK